MELIIAGLIGIVLGFSIFLIMSQKNMIGNLRVDSSDLEDDPYLFLELETDVKSISRKKYVLMKVRVEDFIPHK